MTERYYQDGTEPDVLPHYSRCSGPCDQGRKPCPCPVACQREAPSTDESDVFEAGVPSTDELNILGIFARFIIGILAMVGFGVLVGVMV